MLWTWSLVCILIGEFTLYFILLASKRIFPYEETKPLRTKVFFYVLCLSLFVIGGITFFSYREATQQVKYADLLSKRFTAVGSIETAILRMESTQRGFLITGQKSYLDPYYRNKERIPGLCDSIKALYKGTTDQRRAEELCSAISDRIVTLDRNIEIRNTGKRQDVEEALLATEGKNIMEVVILTGKDLEDRSLGDYNKAVDFFLNIGNVRVYLALAIVVASLIQMVFAAILGRSKTPTQPSQSPNSDQTFFP